MRRQLVIEDGLPTITLHDLSPEDAWRVERAIEHFIDSTPHNNKTFCDLLRSEIANGCLSTEAIERLSVWCHTDQPPNGISDSAAALARELLGTVPPRLRQTGRKRVEDYNDKVNALAATLGTPTAS